MPPKLETSDLTALRDGTSIVDGVSIAVAKAEVLAVVGPSGAGKSSFLRLLNRLDEPTEGTVLIDGTDYRELPPTELRCRIGFVPQEPGLRNGTVAENVTIGPRLRDRTVSDEAVDRLLSRVDLDGYASRDVSTLSGGEAQRVAIARTIITEPEVVLLDEPTASLDADAEARVEELFTDLITESYLTCVLVTHDRDQARRLADRVAVFEDGRVTAVGDIGTVIA
jgi:putative ABC transport system ATP-binding protein